MTFAAGPHAVQFYGSGDALAGNVCSALAVPLLRGEAAIVIAAEEHRDAFAAELRAADVDVAALRAAGRYLEFDAARTLATFMTDDGPDEQRFRAVVGRVVHDAVARHGAVSAYGEMVGLLAAAGQLVAALQLETLWSRLMSEVPFRLLCGYPREFFAEAASPLAMPSVCTAHDAVARTTTRTAAVNLPPDASAGALARRASRETCLAWGLRDREWVDDLLLVVSELVGNAVRHGSSQISLSLDARRDGLSLSVTDGSHALPEPRTEAELAEDGRGFAIIDALSDGWGVERQPLGKRVWVQLRPCPPAQAELAYAGRAATRAYGAALQATAT